MDVYSSVVDYVSNLPATKTWPEFQDLFQRIALTRPKHWLLPVHACEAVGGSAELALPAIAAIACAQIGIVILDDMLDEDPRGEYHHLGTAISANLAASFQSTGLEAVSPTDLHPETRLIALHTTNRMILKVALGQQLDVQGALDESAYWRIVESKSASFFSTAMYLGALFGGACEKTATGIQRFGYLYGEMIQIHDDLSDTMAVPASSDWLQHRSPLPILFAQIVDHPARTRFIELYRDASNPESLSEAQNILVECGAISYCIDQLWQRYTAITKILEIIPLARRPILEQLCQDVIEPIWNLLRTVGEYNETIFMARSGQAQQM